MTERHGLGDPRIPWTVLLTASPAPSRRSLDTRLATLAKANGWTVPNPLTVTTDGDRLTLAADHRYLDGQAMLAALAHLIDSSVASSATGADDRPAVNLGGAGIKRLMEAMLRPSAVLPATGGRPEADDVMVHLRLPRRVTTSELVVAAARSIQTQASGPISVAVGVARRAESRDRLADNSGYLRIRDARGLSRAEVSQFLRTAPLQPDSAPGRGLLGSIAGLATRALASRLGSTLLVSHLGGVTAESLTDLAFYPVSGGASGVSLGAATLSGRTTITLRARGERHDREGLERLLETIAAAIE